VLLSNCSCNVLDTFIFWLWLLVYVFCVMAFFFIYSYKIAGFEEKKCLLKMCFPWNRGVFSMEQGCVFHGTGSCFPWNRGVFSMEQGCVLWIFISCLFYIFNNILTLFFNIYEFYERVSSIWFYEKTFTRYKIIIETFIKILAVHVFVFSMYFQC